MTVESWGGIGARILIVGEAPGKDEVAIGAPFVGAAGRILAGMLMEADIIPKARLPHPAPWRPGVGMNRTQWLETERLRCASIMRDFWRGQPVYLANLCGDRPPGNDLWQFTHTTARAKADKLEPWRGIPLRPNLRAGIQALYDLIRSREWDMVVGCGAWALWALTDGCARIGNVKGHKVPTGIGDWRGSQLTLRLMDGLTKVVPIYHPAAILRNWPWRYITVHDLRKRVAPFAQSREPWPDPGYDFIVRPSFDAAMEFIVDIQRDLLAGPTKVAWDLETRRGLIACVGLATSPKRAICIPLMCLERDGGYWSPDEEWAITHALRWVLNHPNHRLIGQNFLYDSQYIALEWGVIPTTWQDTMIDHHVLFAGMLKGLDFLSSMYCEYHRYWKGEGKNWDPRLVPEDDLWVYNCKDACITFEAGAAITQALASENLTGPREFQMRLYPVVLRMMLRGVRVDHRRRGILALELFDATQKLERSLNALVDPAWIPVGPSTKSEWFRSPKQTMTLLYEVLGIDPVVKRTKEGSRPTADDAALEIVALREPLVEPICHRLALYRKLENSQTVLESKVDGDGRMRSSYNVAGTETYRFSSSENAFGRGMNLQNVTSGDEED